MIEVHPLLLLFMGELLFVTTVGMVVMVVLSILKKRRDRDAARKLIERIKSDEERRKGETREILNEKYGITDEPLESSTVMIDHAEKFLYQTIINAYLNRDADAFENFAVDFESSVAPYRDLAIPEAGVTVVHKESQTARVQEIEVDESDELKVLREENARLSEELRITMDTMSRMLNEYASMYGGGTGADLDKEKMLKMFQAEAAQQEAARSAAGMEEASVEPEAVEVAIAEEEIAPPSEAVSEPELDLLVEDEEIKEVGELDEVDWDEVEQDILESQGEEVAEIEVTTEDAAVQEEEPAPAVETPAVEPPVEEEVAASEAPVSDEVDEPEGLELGEDLEQSEEDEVIDLDEDEVIDLDEEEKQEK
ncbi:hypothetical protein [Solemya velesiana gill symbiont]|uniref:Uncharacterized protein n=1 Tax=Solemya velesiana gill symbiont TaxID=1918948 RepID=A0A1T2KXJ9_9GAMM|nr:hypothetical protein [Solemya velesiana gill symbiont]OOZ37490.1 hypothetical protein BOW51_02245 [Solemya velesiana gill symbiont]